jgi:hypothetical protein
MAGSGGGGGGFGSNTHQAPPLSGQKRGFAFSGRGGSPGKCSCACERADLHAVVIVYLYFCVGKHIVLVMWYIVLYDA